MSLRFHTSKTLNLHEIVNAAGTKTDKFMFTKLAISGKCHVPKTTMSLRFHASNTLHLHETET